MRLEGLRPQPGLHGSPSDATGSRECAPDDRLRIVRGGALRHVSALLIPLSRPNRGPIRDRHVRGAGCGGRGSADNERRWGGRRSRVVL